MTIYSLDVLLSQFRTNALFHVHFWLLLLDPHFQQLAQCLKQNWHSISISFSRSWSRDQTWVSCIAGRFFTILATGEAPLVNIYWMKIFRLPYIWSNFLCHWKILLFKVKWLFKFIIHLGPISPSLLLPKLCFYYFWFYFQLYIFSFYPVIFVKVSRAIHQIFYHSIFSSLKVKSLKFHLLGSYLNLFLKIWHSPLCSLTSDQTHLYHHGCCIEQGEREEAIYVIKHHSSDNSHLFSSF